MACTIDHLRPDHGVRVLRDFTDARGRQHRAGESGIVRQMNLDLAQREIWIEWEQNGARARLHFALSAKTGPGNGRMREYFEVGDCDASAAPPPAATLLAPKAEPVRKKFSVGSPLPSETSLGERAVACDCDPALHRPVLLEFSSVNACLRCGTVTCTRSVGDDGRHTGDWWHAYLAVAVSQPVLDWLSLWPRVKVRRHDTHRWPMAAELVRRDFIYLPADARCATAADLSDLETRQAGRAGEGYFPKANPPADLPPMLQGFADIWEAARLRPDSELRSLITFAQLRSPASAIAAGRLVRRSDAFDVMVSALRHENEVWQSAGLAMARTARPIDPRLASVLIEILHGLSLAPLPDVPGRIVSCGRFEALLVVIADLKLATPEMFAALTALQRRLVRDDADLVRAIGIVLRELRGEPPLERTGPYLP